MTHEGAPRRPFCRFRSVTGFTFGAAVFALAASGCRVGDPTVAQRWAETTPRPPSVVTPDIAYGPLAAQRFDLYASSAARVDGRTIVFVHGGAWTGGDRTQVPGLLWDLGRYGWNIVSIDYRLACSDRANVLCTSARFTDQISDVKLAIRFVKAHASRFGIDPNRVVVAGYSAGGHLATIAGLSAGSMEPPAAQMDRSVRAVTSAVRGYLSFNGPTDMTALLASHDGIFDAYLAPSAALLFRSCVVRADHTAVCDPHEVAPANAATWIDAEDPPGYLFSGGIDTIVPPASQAIPFERRVTRVTHDSGRVWLDIGEKANHFGFSAVNYQAVRDWLQAIVR